MMPLNPKGKKPPDPAFSRMVGSSISSGLICQLWKSTVLGKRYQLFTCYFRVVESNYAVPLKHPQMMTYETIHKLHIVKMLLKRVDSLTPKVKMATAPNWTNKTTTKQLKE